MTDDIIGKKQYTDKEIAVFESVADLLSEGRNPHELKVAEIAQRAGIGKGTAYEYFSSKEDLLRKAISYQIMKECFRVSGIIEKSTSFRECFMGLVDTYDEMMDSRIPNIWAVMITLGYEDFCILQDDFVFPSDEMSKIEKKQTEMVLKLGIQENLIDGNTTRQELGFAITGVVSAYIYHVRKEKFSGCGEEPESIKKRYKEQAWKMFLKMLS